jgi:hypothetical protein
MEGNDTKMEEKRKREKGRKNENSEREKLQRVFSCLE